MEDHDKDDMDSLFEGMVLFIPSPIIANDACGASDVASSEKSCDTTATTLSSSSQPLDENLFSDLNVITLSQPDIVEPDLSSTTKSVSVLEKEATSVAFISRQPSRKKKRAGIRIGYGRDIQQSNDQTLVSHSIDTLPAGGKSLQTLMNLDRNEQDATGKEDTDFVPASSSKSDVDLQNGQVEARLSTAEPDCTANSESHLKKERDPLHDEINGNSHLSFLQDNNVVSGAAELKESTAGNKFVSGTSEFEEETSKQVQKGEEQKDSDVSFEAKYEHIKAEISDKLRRAQQMITSISSARKDSRRKRRKAAEDVELASQRYRELEKQLEEACETEDFEMADSLSEKLAASDQEKEHLSDMLRDAEADCDDFDSKMQEVLQFQIASEEECISLLQKFSLDCASNANLLFENAEIKSSKEMDEWFASVESFEAKKMELEITSDLVNKARSTLNNSIEMSVENDRREKDLLHEKKIVLMEELESLLALVRAKQAEIAETDSKIEAVDKRIAEVISGVEGTQSGIHSKFEGLQSDLSELERESESLSVKKKEIDDILFREKERVESLRKLAKTAGDEATEYQENLELRKSLMLSVVKSREEKLRLTNKEDNTQVDIQCLRLEISAARASLQDLSSRKSNIQQDTASQKQRIFFIEKRIPELEAEKKVAASARNFKEAARIAAEAKTLTTEKERHQVTIEDAMLELGKLEGKINEATTQIQEIEGFISSLERELAVTRFQRFRLLASFAAAERAAALELGDVEEASVLLAEAEAAELAAKQLETLHDITFVNLEEMPSPMAVKLESGLEVKLEAMPISSVSVKLESGLDGEQLAESTMS